MSSKVNVIVLAKANTKDDTAFYEVMLKHDSHMRDKAFVYVLSSVEDFENLLSNLAPNFSFILLIHSGLKNQNEELDRINFEKRLNKLPYYSKLVYYFTSRTPRTNETFTMDFLYDDLDYSKFSLNRVGDLIASHSQISKKIDFAVITALFEDEHKSFDANMQTQEIEKEKNLKKGRFLQSKIFSKDYTDDILLSWQQDIGMVDAAAFSARLITKYEPKFLIMGGVCGGLGGEVSLYDVIIPRNIVDYFSGKYVKGHFEPRPLRAEPSQELVDYLERNKVEIKRNMEDLAGSTEQKILSGNFKIHFGNYACGPWVIKTNQALPEIVKKIDADIVGLEMESLGVVRAGKLFAKSDQYCLVVKSVMDFTDENKTDGYKGLVKATAAQISYLCVRAIIPLLKDFKDFKIN